MPRKPQPKKVPMIVNGKPIPVTFHPPNGKYKSWYAYWPGAQNARSTRHRDFDQAYAAVEAMLQNEGKPLTMEDVILTDQEFEAIQRAHFGRATNEKDKLRAAKSLQGCLDAIAAFKKITRLEHISKATPDDCARFQRKALTLSKSWRLPYPKRRTEGVTCLSPHTVDKWSRALQAAFERANRNARKKCVRGVVSPEKLLRGNPWDELPRMVLPEKPIRQFSDEELISIMDYFQDRWTGVTAAGVTVKLAFWTWSRLSELTSLRWDDLRMIGDEYHFEIEGKMGVKKWAKIPETVYRELNQMRTDSEYVLAAYNNQLRTFYQAQGQPKFADCVGSTYQARAFADWFQERIGDWARETGHHHATPHVFRKTALQRARSGEDINRQVAADARLGEGVLLKHYVSEGEREHRHASNRMYHRLVSSMTAELAQRFGYIDNQPRTTDLQARLYQAMMEEDWKTMSELLARLQPEKPTG